MSVDIKGNTSIAPGEAPTRAGIAASLLSIGGVVAVANVTARAQLVNTLNGASIGPAATRPLVVARADARGAHILEYTLDGSAWFPVSGLLSFTDKTAADAFGASYASLLTVGDRCMAAGVEYRWNGAWIGGDYAISGMLATGWTDPAGTGALRVAGGYASINARLNATGGAGSDTILTLPTYARPPAERVLYVPIAGVMATIIIQTAGAVLEFGRGTAARTDARMASIPPWPVG